MVAGNNDTDSNCEMSDLLPLTEDAAQRPQTAGDPNPSAWRDLLGITASVACAIHCAAMPFVIGFLPALGLSFLAEEAFHKWMAGACFVLALAAFIPGWRRHRRCAPALVGLAGLAIVTATAFGLNDECCAACATCTAGTSASDKSEQSLTHTDAHRGLNQESTYKTGEQPEIQAAALSVLPSFIASYAAWWTPLGGTLLVWGHLLNRCFVARCRCCDPSE